MGLWDALEDIVEKGVDKAAEWIDEEVGADGVISDFVAEHRDDIVDGAAAIATSDDPWAEAEEQLGDAYDVVETEVVDGATNYAAEYVGEDVVNLVGDVAGSDDPMATVEQMVDDADLADVLSGAETLAEMTGLEDELAELTDGEIAERLDGHVSVDEDGNVTFTPEEGLFEPDDLVGIGIEDILSGDELDGGDDEIESALDEAIELFERGVVGPVIEPESFDPAELEDWVIEDDSPVFTVEGGEEYNPDYAPAAEAVAMSAVQAAPSDFEIAITQAESVDASVGALFEEL